MNKLEQAYINGFIKAAIPLEPELMSAAERAMQGMEGGELASQKSLLDRFSQRMSNRPQTEPEFKLPPHILEKLRQKAIEQSIFSKQSPELPGDVAAAAKAFKPEQLPNASEYKGSAGFDDILNQTRPPWYRNFGDKVFAKSKTIPFAGKAISGLENQLNKHPYRTASIAGIGGSTAATGLILSNMEHPLPAKPQGQDLQSLMSRLLQNVKDNKLTYGLGAVGLGAGGLGAYLYDRHNKQKQQQELEQPLPTNEPQAPTAIP